MPNGERRKAVAGVTSAAAMKTTAMRISSIRKIEITTAAGGVRLVNRSSAIATTMLDGMRTTSRTPKRQSRLRSAIQIAAITDGMPDATSGEGSTVTIASDDPSVIAIRICDDRRN